MKNYEARVYVRQGTARIAHLVRIQAESVFAAQQQLTAQYGSGNLIVTPYEVSNGGSTYNSAPWMEKW